MVYVQSKNNYNLFIENKDDFIIIVAIYVDDLIVTRDVDSEVHSLKSHLNEVFGIKDLGILHLNFSHRGWLCSWWNYSQSIKICKGSSCYM